jgi:hypothetical protein
VAMMVLLLDARNGDLELGAAAVSELAKLGVTNLSLLRDHSTVGVVLEGWLFDPARYADAAATAIAAEDGAKGLQPVMHMAVSTAAIDGAAVGGFGRREAW